MPTVSPRLVVRWIIGAVAGTLAIAVTSPLFVRSYLPLQVDPVRGVWTLPQGSVYRWRSEGYANTLIGEHGMPGRLPVNHNGDFIRVALWGDSQAEGVCVADQRKIHRRAEQREPDLSVLPLARSGEDAATWLTQMPAVERALAIDVHVILTVDLPDLLAASSAPLAPPDDDTVKQANAALAARLPAFVIQGARNLLRDTDDQPRTLRFSLGQADSSHQPRTQQNAENSLVDSSSQWDTAMRSIRDRTELPVIILYAPVVPQIIEGQVIKEVNFPQQAELMKLAAETAGLVVIDLRPSLIRSMEAGTWPHGFHNGRIGSGHLNADGNQLIALALVDAVNRVLADAR